MTGTEYQRLAMRTNDGESTYRLGKAVACADSVGEIDFGHRGEFLRSSSGRLEEVEPLKILRMSVCVS